MRIPQLQSSNEVESVILLITGAVIGHNLPTREGIRWEDTILENCVGMNSQVTFSPLCEICLTDTVIEHPRQVRVDEMGEQDIWDKIGPSGRLCKWYVLTWLVCLPPILTGVIFRGVLSKGPVSYVSRWVTKLVCDSCSQGVELSGKVPNGKAVWNARSEEQSIQNFKLFLHILEEQGITKVIMPISKTRVDHRWRNYHFDALSNRVTRKIFFSCNGFDSYMMVSWHCVPLNALTLLTEVQEAKKRTVKPGGHPHFFSRMNSPHSDLFRCFFKWNRHSERVFLWCCWFTTRVQGNLLPPNSSQLKHCLFRKKRRKRSWLPTILCLKTL